MNPEPKVDLEVDGQRVRMNAFVRAIFISTIRGMIGALDGVPADPGRIVITIERGPEA